MNNRKNIKSGISLLVLVITIIVVLVLSGTVILSLVQNSPVSQANEATFKSDLDAIKSDLSMYVSSQYAIAKTYNSRKLNANELYVEYNGTTLPGKTIKDIIPALATTDKYNGQFEIVNGKLVYLGTDRTKKRWAQDISVEVLDADRLDAVITSDATLPVSAGTDVVATIKYSSNASIDTINLVDKLELLDENSVAILNQPEFVISAPSGTALDTLRTVNVTIKTDALVEGTYKLKLKPASVYNIYDVTMTKELITNVLFEIDNTPPTNPAMTVDPTGWTSEDVTVTITYPTDSTVSEYSMNGTDWSIYTLPVVVTSNNTTVYARATDLSGNQSGQSTITIANIDREKPVVDFLPNGGVNLPTVSTKVTVTDVGVSSLKNDSLQYVWDTQNITAPVTGWNSFASGDTITTSGDNTYYLWIIATDNAGNTIVTKSNSFTGDITPPVNPSMSAVPTGWTNGNVTVTITYPPDADVKEYSTDGTIWSNYINPVIVTANNTTVYAMGTDASGNQSGQSTMTIANIDKVAPTVIYGTNGGTNIQTASTTVSANDLGGSDINTSTMQYVWDTQNVSTPASGWTTFTNGQTITKTNVTGVYYLWVKVLDNAGNITVTKSNSFGIDVTPPVNPSMSASPTGWTNGNVTVTITYPADATIKEYSTDGTIWTTYSTPVVVTANNTTVYARATDASGNQSGQSTLTVANIDKQAPAIAEVLSGGAIYDDPTFSNGYNSTGVYNNLGNGLVTNTRTAISDSPVGSQYGLVIRSTGAVEPGYGGFYFATPAAANKVFTTRIIAKIPVGYYINWGSNAIGTNGAEVYWMTSQAGTGSWQEYIYKVKCGSTGPFSTTNFYYLTGGVTPTASSPLEWTVAYANVFETDKWSPSNMVMFSSSDNNGIVAYGINQSSSVQPTFTSCTSSKTVAKSIQNITASGTYYVWVKDIVGNVTNKSIVINNIDAVAPQISTNVRSVINTSFSNWILNGGAYINGSGQLVLPSTSANAISPYFQVDGNPWMHTLDATTNQSSPQFTPDGGVLMGSSYYDASYVNVVSNNTYSGNGYAERIPLGGVGHASWDGWGGYGPNIKYVRLQVLVDAYYSNPTVTCYNPVFTTVQSVLSPSKKIIVTVTETLSGIKTKKWLSGSKTVDDFKTAGTTFDTEFTVTVNGTYTVYTEDNAGNKTVQQVVITQIG